MRVEEMYYIKAEGEAMSGNVYAAKRTLEDFVKTYRNPSYSCTASSAQELQDDIWLQRRMELWGEGFSLFDILRLKIPVVRMNTNYEAIDQYNIEPESQILIYRIPQCEMETNKGITDKDNNPAASQPTVLGSFGIINRRCCKSFEWLCRQSFYNIFFMVDKPALSLIYTLAGIIF